MYSTTDPGLPFGAPEDNSRYSSILPPTRYREPYTSAGEILEIKRTVHGVYRNVILYN